MNNKIVFFRDGKLLSFLTRIFTGCHIYHCGIYLDGYIYEMTWDKKRSKRYIGDLDNYEDIIWFDSPKEITKEYHEGMLKIKFKYGWKDFFIFGLKPFYKIFKLTPKDHSGLICSELVNEDLISFGWNSPWDINGPPPSPCDLYRYFVDRENENIQST